MNVLIEQVRTCLDTAFRQAFPELEADFSVIVTRATQAKFGHYQCNSAMGLAKALRQAPRAIAEAVAAEVDKACANFFEPVEIAGPGFINLTLRPSKIAELLTTLSEAPSLVPHLSSPEKVVIDFSSPNIAKEMHVGHLRSTIIGDALARLFEAMGADVLRLNHVGDWGTAFGMLIAYLHEAQPAFLAGDAEATLSDLVQWYRASKVRFDEDPDFKKRAQAQVVTLQAHEEPTYSAWKRICAISEQAYDEIYNLLGVTLTVRGESFYNPYLAPAVKSLEDKKMITVSQGAKCVYLDGFVGRENEPLPFMVQKSDGGYNYATTDIAALEHRVKEEKAQRIIYVTDAGQSLHFQMLFACAEKAGLVDRTQVRLDHVPFGLVLGDDGKKFKTRSGDTERLIDLLTTAIDKSREIIDERELDLSESEKQELALCLGIGAVKYADLSTNRISDYQFSYDKMLRFEGNTAAFLLYAYVRSISIMRKVGIEASALSDEAFSLDHPSEQALAVHLCQFPEVCLAMADDLLPSRLADYLYQLATLFNQFFRDCRVEGSAEQNGRLKLAMMVQSVLKQGLTILGLKTVSRM